ncbi:MAG: HAD-IIB family hydrolase [Paracoccaceae bacterium]
MKLESVKILKSLEDLSQETCRDVIGVLADIDDTITTEGRLRASAYAMLERLTNAGLIVIPITGRPAGWCDMIARFWPVAGIVGENGVFAMRYDHDMRKMRRMFHANDTTRIESRRKLDALANVILDDVSGTALASDQSYREADLAIDFCEDVPALPEDQVDRIVAHFHAAGAVAMVSSIHVNGWFGDWDKLTMSKQFLATDFGIDLDAHKDKFIFCGDSPNRRTDVWVFPKCLWRSKCR